MNEPRIADEKMMLFFDKLLALKGIIEEEFEINPTPFCELIKRRMAEIIKEGKVE
jgi:hypothetical protein